MLCLNHPVPTYGGALLVAVDVQELTPVVFDSYEKEDGTRKSEYGRYGSFEKDQTQSEVIHVLIS